MTDFAELMATVHVAPETESHPLQPLRSRLGLAVSVTTVSIVYVSEQSAPQSMPDGLELALPRLLPRPALLTVSTKRFRLNVAVTDRGSFIVSEHVVPEAASQPFQPSKVDLIDGLAVRFTDVPTL